MEGEILIMKPYRDAAELKREIVNRVNSIGIKIITLDGKDNAGKSCLAKRLCADTEYIPIDLDDDRYLHKNKGGFVDFIKHDNLVKDIRQSTDANKTVIISGICIQKVLDKLGIKPDLTLYCKRLSSNGAVWYDGIMYFDYTQTEDDVIRNNRGKIAIFYEIVRYHYEYKPDENCDMIYERLQEVAR